MRRRMLCDERGSALLAAICFAFVLMVLGLALFDLGRIENRLVLANKTDAQAFEIAQAGLERAMDRLLRTFTVEQAANPIFLTDRGPSWADGHTQGGSTIQICASGCTTAEFRAVHASYLSNMAFSDGTYAVAFKLLTSAEAAANPYGQACAANAGGTCTDLILVRSHGTMASVPPGYTGNRVIQALLKVGTGGAGLDGLVTGSQTRSINGNVNVAGTIAVISAPDGVPAWELRGTANQANNWSLLQGRDVDAQPLLDRLRPRPLICPPARTCGSSADFRESLNAFLLVRRPYDVPAVKFRGGGDAGSAIDSGPYGTTTNPFDPQRRGMGPINGVLVADGCIMPCTQFTAPVGSFDNPGNIYTADGNITNPYPVNAPTAFPMLTDRATVNNATFDHYACPAGFSPCSGTEFFTTNALGLGATDLTFTTGADFTCTHAACTTNRINGVAFLPPGAVTPLNSGSVCWTPGPGGGTPGVLEFKTGPNCSGNLTSTLNPLLIYTTGTFQISGNIRYSGAAIFLTQPGTAKAPAAPPGVGVFLVDSIVTRCVDLGNGDPCGRKFLVDPVSPLCPSGIPNGTPNCATDMFSVLTTSPTNRGNMTFAGHNNDTVMGVFYAGVPETSNNGGVLRIDHQITVIGSAAASQLDVPNVPDYFQVPGANVAVLNFSGAPYSIATVPGFWRVCGPGIPANPTTSIFPATATPGVCGYN